MVPRVGVRTLTRWKGVPTEVGLVPRQGKEGILAVSGQGAERKCIVVEPGRHHLNQVVKATSASALAGVTWLSIAPCTKRSLV